jgi:hypothetical protein
VRFKEGNNNAAMLIKCLIELRENSAVIVRDSFLICRGWRICVHALGKEQNELLPTQRADLHRLPIAVEPFVAGNRSPRIEGIREFVFGS